MKQALVAAILVVTAVGAAANYAQNDPYEKWMSHSGVSCCNKRDCSIVPHQHRADGTYLEIQGRWWRANQNEAREQQPIDGNAHACVLRGHSKPICYALPWSAS